MVRRHRHSVIFILLACYLFLGAVGCLETMTVFGFSQDVQHMTEPLKNHPPVCKAYWTQHTHIPSTVKISVPYPEVYMPSGILGAHFSDFLFLDRVSKVLPGSFWLLPSPRAAPEA